MAYTFDFIEARDPSNPAAFASNASITIYAPGDATKTPLAITDTTGSPLPNPITVNQFGYGPAFMHATLDRVAWSGAAFSNFFTSYEGMKNEAKASKDAAQVAASSAASAAAEVVTTAAVDATGSLKLTKADGSILDVGVVKGAKGDQGAPGPQGPAGISNLSLDEDGTPFFAAGSNAVQVLADTDGAPYYV